MLGVQIHNSYVHISKSRRQIPHLRLMKKVCTMPVVRVRVLVQKNQALTEC